MENLKTSLWENLGIPHLNLGTSSFRILARIQKEVVEKVAKIKQSRRKNTNRVLREKKNNQKEERD